MVSEKAIRVTRYPAEVFWSEEDEGYIAIAPDLEGASAWGATEAEALAELRIAIEAWMEAALAAGNHIPEPTQPRLPGQYSGKLLLRIPRELHAELDRSADAQGVSLNQYLVYLLTKRQTAKYVAGITYAFSGGVIHKTALHRNSTASAVLQYQTDLVGMDFDTRHPHDVVIIDSRKGLN